MLTARMMSVYAVSNRSIAWASLIGGLGTLVFVPEPASADWAPWLLIAILAQAGFATVVILLRAAGRPTSAWAVAGTLAAAGAVRGAIIAMGAAWTGSHGITALSLFERGLNSAIICVIGGGLIGGTLAWQAEFRQHYRVLLDRAVMLERARTEDLPLDPSVLAEWTSMKTSLDAALSEASDHLLPGATQEELLTASRTLQSAVDVHVRPHAHAMWLSALPERPPLGMRGLFAAVIGAWQPPTREILAFFAVVIGPGAIVRVGLSSGIAFTLSYLLITGIILVGTSLLAAHAPRWAPLVALATLLGLPVSLFILSATAWTAVTGQTGGTLADAIVAIQTPFSVVLVAMAVAVARDRQGILEALQSRIDGEVSQLLLSSGISGEDAVLLSVFVHHSVQSELSAVALQLQEAAQVDDATSREALRMGIVERLVRLQEIDPRTSPTFQEATGADRIAEIIRAWSGILEIDLELPGRESCRPDQWFVAAQVIEEALANASRHGDARHVSITGTCMDHALLLRISDDGSSESVATTGKMTAPGIGSQWLERIAPGEWSLTSSPRGTILTISIS